MAVATFLFFVELIALIVLGYQWDLNHMLNSAYPKLTEKRPYREWFFVVLTIWILHTCISLTIYFD